MLPRMLRTFEPSKASCRKSLCMLSTEQELFREVGDQRAEAKGPEGGCQVLKQFHAVFKRGKRCPPGGAAPAAAPGAASPAVTDWEIL